MPMTISRVVSKKRHLTVAPRDIQIITFDVNDSDSDKVIYYFHEIIKSINKVLTPNGPLCVV